MVAHSNLVCYAGALVEGRRPAGAVEGPIVAVAVPIAGWEAPIAGFEEVPIVGSGEDHHIADFEAVHRTVDAGIAVGGTVHQCTALVNPGSPVAESSVLGKCAAAAVLVCPA